MSALRIDCSGPSDAAAVADIRIRSWQAAYRGILPDMFLDAMDAVAHEQALRWELSRRPLREAWLLSVGGRPVGYVTLGARGVFRRQGEVFELYLVPEAWGQGAGWQLFTFASERLAALRCRQAVVRVLERNERARRFYERCGWEFLGVGAGFEVLGALFPTVYYRTALAGQALRPGAA